MYDVISAAKNTQWLSFPRSCTKYTHSHVANEDIDFQVVPGKNYFASFNKKFGFELLRSTNKDGKDIIQRAKKRQMDDLSCGAISKLCGSEIAIGLTTGFIRIFSTETGDYLPFKFKPDRIGNSVVCLDYSNNDEYLAAVYDSYDINLFGMKTKIKTDTFRFDGLSTFVRFHPVRKFALAIGSYEGPITMLDIQTKKKLFHDKSAHEAPVRDISMFEASQDVFASCSYDCDIKVFDLRRRSAVQKIKQEHPMSTICVSSCGTFCVAGNLKGDVISYDFRSMKEPLHTKRVHDSKVVRVAFVPTLDGGKDLTNFSINATKWEAQTPSLGKSTHSLSTSSTSMATRPSNGMDSFAKFVDVCHHINGEVANEVTPKRKDSWADLMPGRKIHDFSTDSMAETPMTGDYRAELRLKRHSRLSMESPLIKITEPIEIDEYTPKMGQNHCTEIGELSQDLKQKLDMMSEADGKETGNHDVELDVDEPRMPLSSINAANRKRRSTFHDSFSVHITNTNTSSPTSYQPSSATSIENSCPNTVVPAARRVGSTELRSMLTRAIDSQFNKFRFNMDSQWPFMGTDTQSNCQQSHFAPNQLIGGGNSCDRAEQKDINTNNRKERTSSSSLSTESKRRRMPDVHVELEEITEEGSQFDASSDDFIPRKRVCNVDHVAFVAGFNAFIKKLDENGEFDMASDKSGDPVKQQMLADKENRQNNHQQNAVLPQTPNRFANESKYEKGELITMSAAELNRFLNEVLNERMNQLQMQVEHRMNKWKDAARNYMRKRLNQLGGHVNYMQAQFFHSDFDHRYRQHLELEAELDSFDEGFAALFHTDANNEQYHPFNNPI